MQDNRTSKNSSSPLIQVTEGGSLTLNDGAEVAVNKDAQTGIAIKVSGSHAAKPSTYTGNGGKVTNGSVQLNSNSKGSISGGTFYCGTLTDGADISKVSENDFSNWKGSALNNSGTINKITGGTFIDYTALVNSQGGSITEISGNKDNKGNCSEPLGF